VTRTPDDDECRDQQSENAPHIGYDGTTDMADVPCQAESRFGERPSHPEPLTESASVAFSKTFPAAAWTHTVL